MKVECVICGDYKGTMSFPQSPITKECTHFPTACLRCLQKMLRCELERKQWEDIKCPECGAVLQYQEIQKFADNDTKKKLDTLIIQCAIQDDPNFLWVCPSPVSRLHYGRHSDSSLLSVRLTVVSASFTREAATSQSWGATHAATWLVLNTKSLGTKGWHASSLMKNKQHQHAIKKKMQPVQIPSNKLQGLAPIARFISRRMEDGEYFTPLYFPQFESF